MKICLFMQKSQEKLVTLTPLAVERVRQFMAKDKTNANGLRVFVMPGGCSGYQYGLVLEREAKNDDITFEERGLKIYVDNQSARLLVGSRIDFVETLQGAGFKIDNPNAVSSCGCGNSFGTAESGGHSHSHGEEMDGGEEEAACACGCGGH
jgi:iron-sulfur cluster assembly protein